MNHSPEISRHMAHIGSTGGKATGSKLTPERLFNLQQHAARYRREIRRIRRRFNKGLKKGDDKMTYRQAQLIYKAKQDVKKAGLQ